MTLYKKIGKRYHPVHDTEAMNGLGNGAHLIIIQDGLKMRRDSIEPNIDALKAAALLKREKIVDIIQKASESRPASRPMTEKQKLAYENFKKEIGDDRMYYFEYPSLNEMAEKILAAILE